MKMGDRTAKIVILLAGFLKFPCAVACIGHNDHLHRNPCTDRLPYPYLSKNGAIP